METKITETIRLEASQCVKCGLCLPYCPTYGLTQDENESPRGRIGIMHALATESIPISAKAQTHLSQCLACRECERVCPAKVEYGSLITHTREWMNESVTSLPIKEPIKTKLMERLVTSTKSINLLGWFLCGIEMTGLRKFAQILRIPKLLGLSSLDALLPTAKAPLRFNAFYPAFGVERGRVGLFIGCLARISDQETAHSSLFVLRKLGYGVYIPPTQQCCGAMALHSGHSVKAHDLAKNNISAFNFADMEVIVTTASGCGATLQEYAKHYAADSESANKHPIEYKGFSKKIVDVSEFVIQKMDALPNDIALQPVLLKNGTKAIVALHTPCTLRNVMKTPLSTEQLLAKIPHLEWQSIVSGVKQCCGSAGTYMLDHPDFAESLLDKTLSELDDTQVNCVASSNIGCALHLKKRFKAKKIHINVVHPITLFALSLGLR